MKVGGAQNSTMRTVAYIIAGCFLLAVVFMNLRPSLTSPGSSSKLPLSIQLANNGNGAPTPPVARTDMPVGIIQQHFPPQDLRILPRKANTYEAFILELEASLNNAQLKIRPVEAIFDAARYNVDIPHPACTGSWLEFGVFNGATINITADYRYRECGPDANPVYGFDTFTGLPEEWRTGFGAGAFSLGGNLPAVRDNVELVQGLFSESLPGWLNDMDKKHKGRMPDVTFCHIDCDIYQGSSDALTLLEDRIASGCVLIFDDLLHYPEFKSGELLSLWEFLTKTRRQLIVIGMKGPLDPYGNPTKAVDISSTAPDYHWHQQSAAFIVV